MAPVNMIRAICIEKGSSSQNPSPHASMQRMKEARPTVIPSTRTISVRSQAMVKVPGTQRCVHSVSRVAARENAAWIGMRAARYQMGSGRATRPPAAAARSRRVQREGSGRRMRGMNAEGAVIGSGRAGLPGIPAYLTSVFELGRRSLKPALPALAFLYFYRLGMGAYMALSDYSFPQGKDALGAFGPQLAIIASFLPLLVLIYTPFLPLQDSLLRGQAMSFLAAIRRVLEESVDFMLSGIVQALVLFVPFVVIGGVAGVLLPAGGGETNSPRMIFLALTMLAILGWTVLATFFMMFATPAVVLEGEGPVQSLRTSAHLASRNLGGILGRLLAFAFLMTFAYVVATIPASILGAVERTAEVTSAPIKIASVIWTSAVDTLFFPFWIAALMVLYRSLRPAAEIRSQAPVELGEEYRPASAVRAPFE